MLQGFNRHQNTGVQMLQFQNDCWWSLKTDQLGMKRQVNS